MKKIYKAWFDGSSKPNPGEMTIGGYIVDENDKTIFEFSKIIGQGTNNKAEYLALLILIININRFNIKDVIIKGDSELVINQVNEKYKTKNIDLKSIRDKILYELKDINWKLEHIYRNENKKADSLTR